MRAISYNWATVWIRFDFAWSRINRLVRLFSFWLCIQWYLSKKWNKHIFWRSDENSSIKMSLMEQRMKYGATYAITCHMHSDQFRSSHFLLHLWLNIYFWSCCCVLLCFELVYDSSKYSAESWVFLLSDIFQQFHMLWNMWSNP